MILKATTGGHVIFNSTPLLYRLDANVTASADIIAGASLIDYRILLRFRNLTQLHANVHRFYGTFPKCA